MQLPGLDELEALVAKAVEEIRRLRGENAELGASLRGLGKEIDDLAAQIQGVAAGQKIDSRKRKRIEKRLESIVQKLG